MRGLRGNSASCDPENGRPWMTDGQTLVIPGLRQIVARGQTLNPVPERRNRSNSTPVLCYP